MTVASNTQPIAILGAGSFGTALAILLARNNNQVYLWAPHQHTIDSLITTKENVKYLPGHKLPDNIDLFVDLSKALSGVSDVLIAVPSDAFHECVKSIKALAKDNLRIAWGTKGLDPEHHQFLHEIVYQELGESTSVAVLSGPSFAREIAANAPTAVSLAGNDESFLQCLIDRLHNDRFRLYKNSDMIGVELCGALKNVLAIAVGVADGLQLGANTRCALITRGLAEMGRLCVACDGKRETLMSLAGIGDLILTCTDDQSRNRRFGLAIGRGQMVHDALEEIGQAVEGLQNAKQFYDLAAQHNVEMPIVTQVYRVLFEHAKPVDVIQELLTRVPKIEE